MPEGPSIVILREQAERFVGRTITHASGNSKQVDYAALEGQPIVALRSWGKHFLIQLPDRALRIHLLMFGSYRINERKEDALVEQMRVYAFDFLRWKKAFVLKQHWLAHTKRICPRCDIPFHKAHLGKTRRRSFFCVKCQKQYPRLTKALS